MSMKARSASDWSHSGIIVLFILGVCWRESSRVELGGKIQARRGSAA